MSDPDGPAVRFEVLGPLRAWRGNAAIDLGSVQQQVVFAVLSPAAKSPEIQDLAQLAAVARSNRRTERAQRKMRKAARLALRLPSELNQ
jgi:hypothetical protein